MGDASCRASSDRLLACEQKSVAEPPRRTNPFGLCIDTLGFCIDCIDFGCSRVVSSWFDVVSRPTLCFGLDDAILQELGGALFGKTVRKNFCGSC